ncbi:MULTISPECIES: acyl-CoA dehydrogenase family protein [unclassified Pseudomonas]|uniref:acyl-CoA dehydrogenase family protein n=1 Tax=unclassified Pseudomonas TaxID=196821 RepID=UPI002AC8FB0A|nr:MULTISPECIES: acyl-CoA dehydrogenase family protein [unclassified Pseudomonas]MEB0040638.1 acyl-CoA dehydrogenase family protein [Pseudomonas sp. MH10]MEB0123149.1 acyl-CoA dehydrogenase family protein [Pseudomonas sp. CCI1.2]WPX64806.1 acyl-CoA dehydrogenase family protein [Pseudomonas sp. MH10]
MNQALGEFLGWRKHGYADAKALGECLQALVHEGLDHLPLPAGGQTLERWRGLACVAGHDLGLCKLYEGHTDALAIMTELGAPPPSASSTWGMWAAEPPQAKVSITPDGDAGDHTDGQPVRLDGRKAWCSGAAVLSHALITAWDEQNRQQLVAVALNQPGVRITTEGWRAVGMGATGSVEVQFERAQGYRIGSSGQYLTRSGFWHGAIGIAACWYGAANALASRLLVQANKHAEPHSLAHLGAVDSALHSAASVLRDSAQYLDDQPTVNAEHVARRSRAVVEATAELVILHVGRALGAGPYCKESHFARLSADLPVFLRQSHAERDLAALGQLTSDSFTNHSLDSESDVGRQPTRMWGL